VRLFLDTSVLLAGSRCVAGTVSARVPERLDAHGESVRCGRDTAKPVCPPAGGLLGWVQLRADLLIQEDVFTIDRATVFSAAKDRPILFSALAWADVLLTLDRSNFGNLLAASSMALSS
jgi:hypothetical protein